MLYHILCYTPALFFLLVPLVALVRRIVIKENSAGVKSINVINERKSIRGYSYTLALIILYIMIEWWLVF